VLKIVNDVLVYLPFLLMIRKIIMYQYVLLYQSFGVEIVAFPSRLNDHITYRVNNEYKFGGCFSSLMVYHQLKFLLKKGKFSSVIIALIVVVYLHLNKLNKFDFVPSYTRMKVVISYHYYAFLSYGMIAS